MRSPRARSRRRSSRDGTQWLSFSDLMSSLLLIFILIMFYIMYQYFDMYEINMAEIARQQFDLDQANATLESERTKLSAAESQVLAQQIKLNAAQKELDDAEEILAAQQTELATAQALLAEKETEIATQQETLDGLSAQLDDQQAKIDDQQAKLDDQQTKIDDQQAKIDDQQAKLDDQEKQIEELVGMRPRIISSISSALRANNINAQVDPNTGAIALESDVLFSTGEYELSDAGKAFIDRFLPVYLDALFDEEYLPYISEVIIEGHTDSKGDYITNLELSQQRALAVATYSMSDEYDKITPTQKTRLRKVATANGRSFSDPVLNPDGTENMDASRRVVFKFRLTDEQMIQQMQTILEEDGEETGDNGEAAGDDDGDSDVNE